MFAAVERATLLYPSPSTRDPNGKHLFILLTGPYGPAKQVLMVSVITLRREGRYDDSCILKPGDHEFIKHESCVAYSLCRLEPAEKLSNGVACRAFTDCGLLLEPVFDRVIAGMRKSPFKKPFAIEFLDAWRKDRNR